MPSAGIPLRPSFVRSIHARIARRDLSDPGCCTRNDPGERAMQQIQRIYVANSGISVANSGIRFAGSCGATLESNDVSVIDTVANTVVATVPVGSQPAGMAVSPDGARLYVANFVGGSVSVIETSSNAVVATITVGAGPSFVTITPDGTRIYVDSANGVSVIDAATNTVLVTVPVGEISSFNMAISRDGARVYVARGSSVSVIDTASNTVVATVGGVGAGPSFLVGTPDGSRV